MATAWQRFVNNPAGPKTIFFWAPTMKWGLVVAGLGDMFLLPPENVDVPLCSALVFSGAIWMRWSMVITPINYNLGIVNAFVASTNLAQLGRHARHRFGSKPAEDGPSAATDASENA